MSTLTDALRKLGEFDAIRSSDNAKKQIKACTDSDIIRYMAGSLQQNKELQPLLQLGIEAISRVETEACDCWTEQDGMRILCDRCEILTKAHEMVKERG